MDDYNKYVTAVNKIFDYIEKMKAGWNNADNKNYIETIDEFKSVVTSKANEYKKPPTVQLEKTSAELEKEQEEELRKDEEKKRELRKQQAANQPLPNDTLSAPAIKDIPTPIPEPSQPTGEGLS